MIKLVTSQGITYIHFLPKLLRLVIYDLLLSKLIKIINVNLNFIVHKAEFGIKKLVGEMKNKKGKLEDWSNNSEPLDPFTFLYFFFFATKSLINTQPKSSQYRRTLLVPRLATHTWKVRWVVHVESFNLPIMTAYTIILRIC